MVVKATAVLFGSIVSFILFFALVSLVKNGGAENFNLHDKRAAGDKPPYREALSKELRDANAGFYILDGKAYTKDQLVSDFFQSAFPRYLWQEDSFLQSGFFNNFPMPYWPDNGHRGKYSEAIFRNNGLPKFETFNRWKNNSDIPVILYLDFPGGEFVNTMESLITELSGSLASATGLKVSYAGLSVSEDVDKNSQISIYMWRDMFKRDHLYKSPRLGAEYAPGEERLIGEMTPSQGRQKNHASLHGALRFTPMHKKQVDGFIIPDANNYITRAECDIWPLHPKSILNALIQECIFRSLGFLETSQFGDPSTLRTWNIMGALPEKTDSVSSSISSIMKTGVSEYDLAILSLAYCPDIHPGMGRYELLAKFYSSNACFDFSKLHKASLNVDVVNVQSANDSALFLPTTESFDLLVASCQSEITKKIGGESGAVFASDAWSSIKQMPYLEDLTYLYTSYVDFLMDKVTDKKKRAIFTCRSSFGGTKTAPAWKILSVEIR
jgi:hypothetical protein